MTEKISYFMKKYQDRIEELLLDVFPSELSEDPTVKAAMLSWDPVTCIISPNDLGWWHKLYLFLLQTERSGRLC